MSQEHEHNKVSLSVHRRWMRRNMILDGSIVGSWPEKSSLWISKPLSFLIDFIRENFKSILFTVMEKAESSSILPKVAILTDENEETFVETKDELRAFLRTKSQKYHKDKRTVLREICEDAYETKTDSESLWQTIQMTKNSTLTKCLHQLISENKLMNDKWSYIFDQQPTEKFGVLLEKSLADCFIILTEKHGPVLKLLITMLNTWFSTDNERCTHCCEEWIKVTRSYLTLDESTFPDRIPVQWIQMAKVFLEDVHPTDFCILLLCLGRSQIIGHWETVDQLFGKSFRSGNVRINLLLLALASDISNIGMVPFYCKEDSLTPTISGAFRQLCSKWPIGYPILPSFLWVFAKAYHMMVVNARNTAFAQVKTQLESSIMFSTNTPYKTHLEKKDEKSVQRLCDIFAYNLKNITGRCEFARTSLNSSPFSTIYQLLQFIGQVTQPYYDLFIAEPKLLQTK